MKKVQFEFEELPFPALKSSPLERYDEAQQKQLLAGKAIVADVEMADGRKRKKDENGKTIDIEYFNADLNIALDFQEVHFMKELRFHSVNFLESIDFTNATIKHIEDEYMVYILHNIVYFAVL